MVHCAEEGHVYKDVAWDACCGGQKDEALVWVVIFEEGNQQQQTQNGLGIRRLSEFVLFVFPLAQTPASFFFFC